MEDIFTNELVLSKDNGYVYHVSDKLLGKGSYGNVYVGKSDNRKVAIKCCKNDENGITNILEACLMKVLYHPNINHAIEILCTEHKLYIIQELALMDLYTYTNVNKNNHICSTEEIVHIFYSLAQAVAVLHHSELIHCDIKASNVLIYPNNVIKLSDFTLALKSFEPSKYTVCSATHRPLECHMKQPWSYALDMWSLGCTFYEVAYNDSLFPNQSFVDKHSYTKKTYKMVIHKRYVNAILEWAKMTFQPLPLACYDVEHDGIGKITYNTIGKLIISLLQVSPTTRVTIQDVLKWDFFASKIGENPKIITPEQNTIPIDEEARVVRYIEQCNNNNNVVNTLAYKLYTQLTLGKLSEYNKAIGVSWIANKMIYGHVEHVNQIIDLDQILVIEREIMQDLHFRCYF